MRPPLLLVLISSILLASCSSALMRKGPRFDQSTPATDIATSTPEAQNQPTDTLDGSVTEVVVPGLPTLETEPPEQTPEENVVVEVNPAEVFCVEGPEVIADATKVDLSDAFALLCNQDQFSDIATSMIEAAYNGDGEPAFTVTTHFENSKDMAGMEYDRDLKYNINNETVITVITAFKNNQSSVKVASTSYGDTITPGYLLENITVATEVLSRGVASEVIKYNTTINVRDNDVGDRFTEVNRYMLGDDPMSPGMMSEHILGADTNKFYTKSNVLTAIIPQDESNVVVVQVHEYRLNNFDRHQAVSEALLLGLSEQTKTLHTKYMTP